jgi:hypothetical protein
MKLNPIKSGYSREGRRWPFNKPRVETSLNGLWNFITEERLNSIDPLSMSQLFSFLVKIQAIPSCANASAPPPQNGSEAAEANGRLCISSQQAHLVGAEVQGHSSSSGVVLVCETVSGGLGTAKASQIPFILFLTCSFVLLRYIVSL